MEGGLRIDAEDAIDWQLLQSICHDALGHETQLASRLGAMIKDPSVQEDWQHFVIPELAGSFHAAIHHVAASLQQAARDNPQQAGTVWITPQDAELWYSTLNQARLALEQLHHLGNSDTPAPQGLNAAARAAHMRSQLYLAIQSLLLEHVLR